MRPGRGLLSIALVVAGLSLAACGDDDVDATTAGQVLGKEPPVATSECRTDQSPTGTDEPEGGPPDTDTVPELRDVGELPPPTFPGNVSPPTTRADDEPIEGDPVDVLDPEGPSIPALGGFRIDPIENGCLDFPVHLEQYGRFRIKSWGDDGIYTRIQVFAPDGTQAATWDTGDPGTFEGYTWEDEGGLPEAGTYVIRTLHRGGSHNSFVLIFYGDPPS